MSYFKIRQNDEVVILTGKDKGKRGRVKKIFFEKRKVVVTGINLIKKHQKPIPNKNQPGGIIKKEALIDLSNIAIFNFSSNKADRVGFKIENGKRIRIFKSNNSTIK